jgi:hypothetical protein
MEKLKPGQVTAKRAYELSDSLAKTGSRPVKFGPNVGAEIRSKAYDREKSLRLKTRADEAVKKAGGIARDYRMDTSSINKAAGRDMPLPSSSQLFDA